MKTIMILGAGRGQVGLYKAAREMGYRSIAVSIDGDYPGFKYADEIDHIDITDIEAVLKSAKSHNVDAIVSACIDISVASIGYACDNLGLRGVSYEAARVSTNKYLMKQAFEKHKVRTANFVKLIPGDDYQSKCAHFRFPVVVKAVDLAGSRGIYIVEDIRNLSNAIEKTMSETHLDYCIVEEYIDGYEFSATSFVVDGEILFILPMGDVRYGEHDEIPVGHYLPFEMSESALLDFYRQMSNGIRALGLDNCAVNADLMLMDEEVYILEMTCRLGANCIPELTSIYIGEDINKIIIDTALGQKDFIGRISDDMIPKTPCYAKMIVSETEGRLKSIDVGEPAKDNADILLFCEKGDNINKFQSTNDCIGQVVTQGITLQEARENADKALSGIKIEVE